METEQKIDSPAIAAGDDCLVIKSLCPMLEEMRSRLLEVDAFLEDWLRHGITHVLEAMDGDRVSPVVGWAVWGVAHATFQAAQDNSTLEALSKALGKVLTGEMQACWGEGTPCENTKEEGGQL